MKNIVNSFKINTLSSRKGLGVGLLFLLLTLGVGQMWGAYYITGSNGNLTGWGTWNNMTESSDGIFWYFRAASGNCECKINTSKNYTNALDASSRDGGFCDTDLGGNTWDAGGNINYWYNSGSYYILVYKPNTAVNTTNKAKVCASTFLPDAGYETTGNTMTYYSNKAASDQTTSALDRTNGSTTALGTVTTLYLKGFNSKMWQHGSGNIYGESKQHYYYKVHRTAVAAGSTGFTDAKNATSWSAGTWTWGSFNDSKYRYPTYSGSLNENLLSGLGSGNYTMSYYYLQEGSKNFRHPSDGSKFNKLTWTIGVPSVSGGAVTSNGTGTGADGSPFSVADGNTITFTASGSQASTDANSVLYVKWGSDSYAPASSTTKTITPTTTKQSMTVKLKYYNSNDDLSGAETTLTIYYQSTLTPSIGISSISPSPANSGDEVTITASRQNAGTANITYQYSLNGTSGWTTIGSATSSTTKTWTVPAITATTTYYFRAQMTYSATTYTSDVVSLKAYGKKTIKVKDTNSWGANFKIHRWGGDAEGTEWPGETANITTVAGQWKQVVLYSSSTNFVFCNGSSTSTADGNKTADQAYASMTDGNCYQIQSGSGASLTLTSTDCPTAPSVTTASATSVATTSVQFNASSVSANNDAITAYGFKWGTTDACSSGTVSASNLGAGTTFSASKTGLTNGTTYYYKAYATNGFGTTYGSVQSFRTKYVTTVTLDKQGGSEGTSEVTANEGSAMPSGKTAPGKTGYTFGGYYANAGGSGKQYYTSSMISANNWDVAASTATIYAEWTANTYTITYNANGGTGTTASSSHTYDAAKVLTTNGYSKTGYNFGGWATSKANADAGTVAYTNGQSVTNLSSTQGATVQLWAIWTPKQSALTFNYQISAEGYGTSGTISAVSATYGAAMPSLSGTMPTAANGYAFMGFYDAVGGSGTKYYNANGSSAHIWNKNTESGTTLYAYYKKAEITAITLDAAIWAPVAAGDATTYITADPTIAPTPEGTTSICWELLYDNDNPVPGEHPAITVSGYKVKFAINGLATGNYKIRATLHTGSGTCGSGTTLSTLSKTFTIATDFDVTVKYMCGTEEIQPSTTVTGKATEWTSVSAPNIFGYTFTTWDLGDGGITKHGNDALTKQENFRFKATYNGTLTAVYRKRGIIYFKKPSDWDGTATVYYYNIGSSSKWKDSGDGTYGLCTKDISYGATAMTRIGSTNIYYYDYEATATTADDPGDYIAFTNVIQNGYDRLNGCQCSYPINKTKGFNSGTPMFVCTNYKTQTWLANYYNAGYWTKYERGSGYTLKIYNKKESGRQEIKSVPFVTDGTNNFEIPFKATVDLDAATTYGFKIVRDDNLYFKNDYDGTMTYSSHDGWPFLYDGSDGSACGITTTAAGSYVFTLSYFNTDNNADHELRVSVTYPAAVNDFQVMYNDDAKWSGTTNHASTWRHPSRIIKARKAGVDTISFFVAKDNTPRLYARKVNSITAGTGAISWGSLNVAGATYQNLSVDSSAVYNFKVTQGAAGVISSIERIGAYTGEYYIRCGALNSKWDNYTIDGDHKMTYSSFSESDANAFGEKFSHYKAKWCPRGTNVKFVIANDYSPCISDTLIQDVDNPYNNIYLDDAWGRPDGELKADGYDGSANITTSETGDRYSANIRFMWNRKTNKISRAYVASSTNPERLFLVLRGNYAIKGTDNENIEDEGTGIPSVILQDDQNWIYEEILYIKPNTRFKLYACYAQVTASPNGAQYFRGSYNSNAFSGDDGVDSENSVVLISGNGEYQKARVLYDFKTNRLICAWLPSETAVSGTLNINADVMIIREHQEAAQYLSFADADSKLTGVKTVYGVMKFNRWVLNNRQQTGTHLPLDVGDQKSIFERSLYFISFPFDVRLGDIFGFGQYGVHWILEYYDGLTRAKNGFWIDSPPNWKYVMPSEATSFVLKANEGYILALDLDQMKYNNTDFWPNDIQTVELFFPSTAELETLKQTTCTIPALSSDYKCTINRTGEDGDRRVKDSYWRCIGTPSLNLYNTAVKDGSGHTIAWKTDYTWHEDEREFPFIYMWNKADNTLTPQSTSTFRFLPMHSYLVQNGGQIIWTNASAKPSSIVSRRENDYQQIDYNWRLELAKDSQMVDQAYIRMSNLEQVTDTFDFGQDLSKEFNATRSNIYSFIGYEKAAANSMPLKTEQTTIVAIGLNIITAGEYTLGMPDGTDGVGVTLVDSETGTRTNLSAGMTYTVTLAAGDYTSRFYLEISPVKETPTGLEPTTDSSLKGREVRKVLIDGVLYIIRDGKIFDARGVMVK